MATSNKTLPIIVAGVAVLAAVAYFGGGFPQGDELTGTVASAERHRSDQVTAADAELGDQAIQDFMQTDTFDRLISDDAFRDAMKSDAFRDALRNDALRDALNSDAFRDALVPMPSVMRSTAMRFEMRLTVTLSAMHSRATLSATH